MRSLATLLLPLLLLLQASAQEKKPDDKPIQIEVGKPISIPGTNVSIHFSRPEIRPLAQFFIDDHKQTEVAKPLLEFVMRYHVDGKGPPHHSLFEERPPRLVDNTGAEVALVKPKALYRYPNQNWPRFGVIETNFVDCVVFELPNTKAQHFILEFQPDTFGNRNAIRFKLYTNLIVRDKIEQK